jgi:hypothetical protein
MRARAALAALLLLMSPACSEEDDDYEHSHTPALCETVYTDVYQQCQQRVVTGECAGAFGFGLLFCVGQVCGPEAYQAVWQCCALAYQSQEARDACIEEMAP